MLWGFPLNGDLMLMRFGVLRPGPDTAKPEDLVFPVAPNEQVIKGRVVVATFDYEVFALLYARAMLRHRDAKLEGHVPMVCPTCKMYGHMDTSLLCVFCGLTICPSRECELFHDHRNMHLV